MRFSYSRLSTFRQCPKQWFYKYVENLAEPESEALILGGIFHEMLEEAYDPKKPKVAHEKYKNAVLSGELERPLTLLPNLLELYLAHYKNSDATEVILAVEEKITVDMNDPDELEEGQEHDTVYGKADRIIATQGLVGIRDTKTTEGKLKYTPDQVRYNPQLLLYSGMYDEKAQASIIDFIEVDEVRIAELADVPINQNGKPSADKKRLELVTYEAYRQKLEELDLLDDYSYVAILEYLEKRGHPLFNRVRIYLDDKEIMEESLQDIVKTYNMLTQARYNEKIGFPRNRNRLCDWCGYKELCQADFFLMSDEERKMFTEKFEIRVDKE